jgi:hypothetical protein
MILRRVISHFRKQEWTAIFPDLVIVLLGDFASVEVSYETRRSPRRSIRTLPPR